jgi:TPR repeat protein
MIKVLFLTLLSFLVVAVVPAGAQDIEKGKEAAFLGDYATALAELRPLAEQGNADAQYSLANLYRDGRGVARDDEQAAAWYQRAAAAGSWWAAFELGMLYWGQSLDTGAKEGAPNDGRIRVHMWLGIAAATENGGCVAVGAPLRDAVAQSMTAAQIASAEERTRLWLAEHKQIDVNVAAAKPGC